MNRIIQNPDGSYHWECPIDQDFHRQSARKGLCGVLVLCAVVILVFLFASRESDVQGVLSVPLLVIGVILLIALPLLYLMYFAENPHEEYLLTEEYVKSGYSRSAIFSNFNKTTEAVITAKYIELTGDFRTNRIYIPAEDMDFVRDYIVKRLPENVRIRYN